MENIPSIRFSGPHLGYLAVLFTSLFLFALSYVITFTAGAPHFPNPYDPAMAITTYFREHPHDVVLCAFFQFASAIPVGIFTVTARTRLKWLGVKAVGPSIAMLGGILVTVTLVSSSLIMWAMAFPGVADDAGVIRAMYYMAFALGGVGYSVPMGLLIAGIAIPAGFMRLLPGWMVVFGVILGVIGETSWLSLLFPEVGDADPPDTISGVYLADIGRVCAYQEKARRPGMIYFILCSGRFISTYDL